MSDYFSKQYKERKSNEIIDITLQDICKMHKKNIQDRKDCDEATKSSYRKETYFNRFPEDSDRLNMQREMFYRDLKTDGFVRRYGHGRIITQAERNHYYRGEKEIYPTSKPSLMRSIEDLQTVEKKEVYKIIADMRIKEFGIFLFQFDYVKKWSKQYSTVLFEVLAQHYGLETSWLDITNDFDVALFFATCFYDKNEKKWKPLTKAETEKDEDSKYGMIFHIPQPEVTRINFIYKSLSSTNKKERNLNNFFLPSGFQPFMRCHMQYSYGIKVTKEYDLQQDVNFEKLRFRHNEELSRKAYNLMKRGDLIYPHDGLAAFGDVICQIKMASEFSEEAFEYAYKKNNYFKNKEDCCKLIQGTLVNGKKVVIGKNLHSFEVSRQRRRQLDREYGDFSIEEAYDIKLSMRNSFI